MVIYISLLFYLCPYILCWSIVSVFIYLLLLFNVLLFSFYSYIYFFVSLLKYSVRSHVVTYLLIVKYLLIISMIIHSLLPIKRDLLPVHSAGCLAQSLSDESKALHLSALPDGDPGDVLCSGEVPCCETSEVCYSHSCSS